MTQPRVTTITEVAESTITVLVPIALRRRNGRPKIVLPDALDGGDAANNQARAAVLRAIARAWDWRRRLEVGEVTTLQDNATAEKISDRFVSRMLRLAYLSPAALEQLISHHRPPAPSIDDLAAAAELPWAEQETVIFGA